MFIMIWLYSIFENLINLLSSFYNYFILLMHSLIHKYFYIYSLSSNYRYDRLTIYIIYNYFNIV